MTVIHYEDTEVGLVEGQSVLDALLDAGHEVPNSCRAGACQTCMLQADNGNIPADAQKGLKQTQVASGYFLACRCYPDSPLQVKPIDLQAQQYAATVIEKHWLNKTVLCLRLTCPEFSFKPGQYLTLWKEQQGRSYSIASLPDDGFIELHIRVYPDGVVSSWVADRLNAGDTVAIQGPMGDCFYTDHDKSQNLILAGTGTGLAPLYGIIRDALAQGHKGNIHLFTAGQTLETLYYQDALALLAKQHPPFRYTTVVQSLIGQPDPMQKDLVIGDLNQVIRTQYPSTKGMRIYLCGSTNRVKGLQKQCFMAGANMSDIHCDGFG